MKYYIVVDDDDRAECPDKPFTANLYLEVGGEPLGVGVGATAAEAVNAAISEVPAFTAPPPAASSRAFCTYGSCTNADHDHTTPVDSEGRQLTAPAPMLCHHCGLPTHYDTAIEEYQHDDPDAPDCFLIKRVNRPEGN